MAQNKIRTILVGIAVPEERSQPAVDRAAQLAITLGAELILFHAAFESYLSGRPFFDSVRLAKSRGELVVSRRRRLEKMCVELAARGAKARSAVVWEEPAYAALLRAAIRDNVDLIVVGAHRSRVNRTPILRQNDWELMRYSSRPVLIVRTSAAQRSGPVVAALDPSHMNDKPAALDNQLAKHAAALAEGLDAQLHVAHCIADSAFPLGTISTRDRQRARKDAQMGLREILDRARVSARKLHVLDGLPDAQLPKLVKELDAQTLVLGALSRRWLAGFVVGNTAERLIHETQCDLLIAKPPEFKTRLPRVSRDPVALPE